MDAQGWAILAAVLGSPVAGVVLTKYFRPNATPLEMIQELQEEAKRRDVKDTEAQTAIAGLQRRERIRDDYIHQLRQHIADGNPPPPPPWPQELTA